MSRNVSRAKAEQVRAAVVARYPGWFTDGNPEPTLAEPDKHCSGWAVEWEEGPADWPHQVSLGGFTEEQHVMSRLLASEFGKAPVMGDEPEPVTMPAGVFVEPVNHVTLGVYPA